MSDLEIKDGYICFIQIKQVKKLEHYITDLKANYKIFINQIEEYVSLRNRIELIFDASKEKISADDEFLESLKSNL